MWSTDLFDLSQDLVVVDRPARAHLFLAADQAAGIDQVVGAVDDAAFQEHVGVARLGEPAWSLPSLFYAF